MPLDALALTLAAAVVHAGWNLLLAREDDPRAASVVALVIGVVLLAPVAAIGWRLDAAALPYVVASAGSRSPTSSSWPPGMPSPR